MKLINSKLIGVSLIGLSLLIGCASVPDIYTDQDPSQDFSSYKSFAWAHGEPAAVAGDYTISPLVLSRINTAIKNSLLAKGYRFNEELATADFAVAYTVGARDKIRVNSYPSSFYGYYDSWSWGYPYYPGPAYAAPVTETRTSTIIQGELAIDVYDVKTKRPVWHGRASQRITKKSEQEQQAAIDNVVVSILKSFGSAPVAE
ncbi:DUF4136 domain-containing protein [Kangiella sp. TOML190]|uniref:DUF4136 domain-containing protein n=1 Tax=Kangiella sp. TOML190 TaxID=2931351 RepID=UPI00203D78C2|nr:DUF4136 domain-containing protein [Kangiella sp. TOML190]